MRVRRLRLVSSSKGLGRGIESGGLREQDRPPNARPEEMQDAVLELFLELDAKEEQFDAPFLFGSAKEGFARNRLEDEGFDMKPLL